MIFQRQRTTIAARNINFISMGIRMHTQHCMNKHGTHTQQTHTYTDDKIICRKSKRKRIENNLFFFSIKKRRRSFQVTEREIHDLGTWLSAFASIYIACVEFDWHACDRVEKFNDFLICNLGPMHFITSLSALLWEFYNENLSFFCWIFGVLLLCVQCSRKTQYPIGFHLNNSVANVSQRNIVIFHSTLLIKGQ